MNFNVRYVNPRFKPKEKEHHGIYGQISCHHYSARFDCVRQPVEGLEQGGLLHQVVALSSRDFLLWLSRSINQSNIQVASSHANDECCPRLGGL